MAKIVGNTVGIPNPQSDYDQTDKTKADYIKNKPDIVAIIKANAVGDISDDMDSSLPPTVEFMIRYLEGLPYGEDVQVLRQELYDNYVSNDDLNNKVAQTDKYISHDMRIENLELANGDISAALDAILAIHDELIGGDEA